MGVVKFGEFPNLLGEKLGARQTDDRPRSTVPRSSIHKVMPDWAKPLSPTAMSSLNHLVSPAGQHWPSPRYMPRGVARIQPMLTRRGGTFWILCASLAVFCYLMLLEEHSVNHFRAFAAASPDPVTSDGRGVVDMMNDVARAQSIIVAVVTLLFARLVDAHSRELVYGISLFFYVLGHILGASSRDAGGDTLVASMIFHIIGQTGLLFVTDVVLADITSLQWRGFAIALPMLPYTLNAYVAAQFSIGVINGPGWVWGYGIFAITVPVALLPVLLVLSSTGRRSIKAMKVENRGGYGNQAFFAKLMSFDPVGLVLIAAIFGLVSYPPQLVPNSVERLSQPKLVAMILVGTCCLPLFLLWEWFNPYASLIPKRIMTNRAVICAVMLVFFTRLAIALRDMHAAILVVILSSWSSAQSSWFISMQWVSLTFFAVVAGLVIRSIHRVKYVTFVGVLVRLIALGMQIGAVTPSTTTAHWFAMEALAGLGGACIDIGARVGSQASASHSDLAMVVAIVRLPPVLGASFAQIIGTAVVQADPVALAISQLQYIDGQDPGVGAYRSILRKLFIIAFSLSVPCIGFALCLPDPYLGDTHNLVDNETQSETATKESIPSQHVVEKGDEYLHATAQP